MLKVKRKSRRKTQKSKKKQTQKPKNKINEMPQGPEARKPGSSWRKALRCP